MSVGPRQYRGSGNPHITEKFQSGLLKGRVYRVIVTVESFGESVQAEKPFSECFVYLLCFVVTLILLLL